MEKMFKVKVVSVLTKKLLGALALSLLVLPLQTFAQAGDSALVVRIQKNLTQIYENNRDSIVKVTSLKIDENSNNYYETSSGFFVNEDGTVVTNAFVTHKAKRIWIENKGILYDAELVGFDPFTSISVIRVTGAKKAAVSSFIEIKHTCKLPPVSTILFSISCELGFGPSPRMGILSGHEINFGEFIMPTLYIRSNIPSFNGSIGGAVFDVYGNFVGMTIASLPDTNGSFVIPAKVILKVYKDIVAYSKPVYAWFGMNTKDAECDSSPCVKICKIIKNSPAEKSGLELGDVILEMNSVKVESNAQFRGLTFFIVPEQRVIFNILRGGKNMKVELEVQTLSPELFEKASNYFDEFQKSNQILYKSSKTSFKSDKNAKALMPPEK